MEIITLQEDDDIISVRDRLDWNRSKRVLLQLPAGGGVLESGLDLVRLRRYADERRLEVGLITPDKALARQARALGLPAFLTIGEGQQNRREWWRGRRRLERVGLPTVGGDRLGYWRPQASDTMVDEPEQPVTPGHWLLRYAGILLFFAAVAFLIVGFAYLVPQATITLKPQVIPVTIRQEVMADPRLSAVDYRRQSMPARQLEVVQSWQAEIETTGNVLLPVAPARGQVILVNLTEEALAVPEGTMLSTASDLRFQTVASLTMVGVLSSTAEVDVVAVELGPQGNVAAGEIVNIEGELSRQLQVSNPVALSGGDVRQQPAVAEDDLQRLRSQARQFLQAIALAEIESSLTEREFLARPTLRVTEVHHELFSHAVGDQTQVLRLKTEASLQATAVDLTLASGLVYEAIAAKAPSGFNLVSSSIDYEAGEVLTVGDQGQVTFMVNGEGVIAAELDLAQWLPAIRGQAPATAMAYLSQHLPLRELPQIEVRPAWFRRMPYLVDRFETEILAE